MTQLTVNVDTRWWVYSDSLPEELKAGSKIIIWGTGTDLDGLVCEVISIDAENTVPDNPAGAFLIESGSVPTADVSGLNGTWTFAPTGGGDPNNPGGGEGGDPTNPTGGEELFLTFKNIQLRSQRPSGFSELSEIIFKNANNENIGYFALGLEEEDSGYLSDNITWGDGGPFVHVLNDHILKFVIDRNFSINSIDHIEIYTTNDESFGTPYFSISQEELEPIYSVELGNVTIYYEAEDLKYPDIPDPGKTWSVMELSQGGWVYTDNRPEELEVGSKIVIMGSGTGLDDLVWHVTQLGANNPNSFQIDESGIFNTPDLGGLNGTWSFAPMGGQEVLAAFEANWDNEDEPEGTYMTGVAAISEGDDDPHLHITDAVNGAYGGFMIEDFTDGVAFKDFEISFRLHMTDSTCCG